MKTEYPTQPLSALSEKIDYGLTASATFTPNGPKFLRITDIVPNRLDWSTVPFCKVGSEEVRRKYSLRAGDIVIARTGATVGYSKRITEEVDAVFASYLVRVRVGHGADSAYVGYVIGSEEYKEFIRVNAGGAAQPNANARVLTSYPVPLPPLASQRKIAAILSAHDNLIENNDQRISLLEEMAQRVYHEWFVDFRYPGHENFTLVDSDLGLIPEGWAVSTLDDVCTRITDGAHKSPATAETGMPMASVKDMTPRSLELATCRLISQEDYEMLVRQDCRPRSGDVLVSKDGANFLKDIFPLFEDSVAVLLSSVAILRPSDRITSVLLSLSLREPTNKSQLKGFVSGAAIPRVVLKDFKVHKLLLPAVHIQRRFEEICNPMMQQAVVLENCNRNLRAIRDLLLPRLISGNIDVAGLDIEIPETAA